MTRKKKPEFVVDENGQRWNLDDFDLDSHGVEAPLQERFQSLMQGGFTPERVSVDIQAKYAKYLERVKTKKEIEEQKAKKAKL
jgi:hypothetical protein